ncbi:hypothetical protein FHS91_003827 [Sphingobium xanthum]|uniref:hypothetical protein n=1 Tax=Sphingobium xanthum TaxID=1387165 RepID=UPI001C8BF55B|nr:hypothetical protein [Sphingobium xanthum]
MTFFNISPLARRQNQILRHLNLALGGCETIGLSTAGCHISMAIDTLTAPQFQVGQQDWQELRPDEVKATASLLVEARSKLSKATSDLLKYAVDDPKLHDLAIDLLTAAVDCERTAIGFGEARGRTRAVAHMR